MQTEKEFDFILWGATSFVGTIIAEHLQKRLANFGDVRWALGGRNPEKLERLRTTLGPDAEKLPLLVGDSQDSTFLRQLASRTRVILSTVGPYLKYGEPLVEACALEGTDYCDLTGEIPFVRSMMDRYSGQAQESGARIVHCAGFDSLPSDLGVLYLNEYVKEELQSELRSVEMQVRRVRGGVSGGTVASAIETVLELNKNPKLRSVLANPYAICPEGRRSGVRQPNLFAAKRSKITGHWLQPFVMAPVNTKVVHATNARLNYPYGTEFTYSEWQTTSNFFAAQLARLSITALFTALYFSWTRRLLSRFVLPAPGQGPNRESREKGFFELVFTGLTEVGHTVVCRVTGDADPGYGSTAKQISEVALTLANTQGEAGFHTPASALGTRLFKPLQEYAGLRFEIVLPVDRS